MPFTLGGSPLAHIGGGIPFAYRSSAPIYIGTTPMVVSSEDFPLIPLVPPPVIPPVSMPPGYYVKRKLRMRYKDKEIEADTPGQLAAKMRALLMEEMGGDVEAVQEALSSEEIHIDLMDLAPYLDLDGDEEDDEMAAIYAIAEALDL